MRVSFSLVVSDAWAVVSKLHLVRILTRCHTWVRHHTLTCLQEEGTVGSRARRKGSGASRVAWVELGPNSFVAQFDDHTVWCGSEALTEQLVSCV